MPYRNTVEDAIAIFEAALRGVQADGLLEAHAWTEWLRRPLDAYRRVYVAGIGKASLAMGSVVECRLGARIDGGVLVVPEGYPDTLPARFDPPERLDVLEAGHPVPDAASVHAARTVLDYAQRCEADDLLLVLISGGGTALCNDFAEGVSLDDARQTFEALLGAGMDIHAMNTVRKHLSRVGGGRLARAAAPAEVLALVVSDVVGDDLSVIASGPTVPDPTTFADAVEEIEAKDLWERLPESVRRHLRAGKEGARPETPKPGDPLFERVTTKLLGTNASALAAARAEAESRGYAVHVVAEGVTGEAREVARRQIAHVLARDAEGPTCWLWGGETTVTVRGDGTGGRNQEWALAAALALTGVKQLFVALSGGTDGRDGPTDAAGAWATPETASQARRAGLDPRAFLQNNDAYAFFDALGQLLKPGPTHTNVMDLQILLQCPRINVQQE